MSPGRAAASLPVGCLAVADADDALFGPGLTNPAGSDIHLIVRQGAAVVRPDADVGCEVNPRVDTFLEASLA